MTNSDIVTNQFVRIAQTPASITERILARLIDFTIIFLYAMGFSCLIEVICIGWFDQVKDGLYFLLLMSIWLYNFLWETFNNGQSPGKRVMKIRVANRDGSCPSLGSFFMRWLLDMIDLGMGGIGLLFIALTKNSQRLGDLAAGTMVIKIVNLEQYRGALDEFYYAKRDYRPVYEEAKNLSQGQVAVIEKAIYSQNEDRDLQIEALAGKVESFLHIKEKDGDKEKFLTTILHDYQYYLMELI